MSDAPEVVRWSLECIVLGQAPASRHDGTELSSRSSDRHRLKFAREALPRALVTQIRGDWKMMKELFALPAHNEKNGICFVCPCTPAIIREVHMGASWRQAMTTGVL